MANQNFITKCKDAMTAAFNYLNNQRACFLVYKAEQYPFNKFILDSLYENFKRYPPTFGYEIFFNNQTFSRKGKCVYFNLHPNNYNIYDATYQLNTLNNLCKTYYKDEAFEIFFTYHYANLQETQDDIRSAINQIVYERFANVVKIK